MILRSVLGASVLLLFAGGGCSRVGRAEPRSCADAPPATVGRRVVTAIDADGRSVILEDRRVPESAITRRPGRFVGNDLWVLPAVPASLTAPDPLVGYHPRLEPPEGGLLTRITTFLPGTTYPPHTTRTLDFGVVVSGEMELIVDGGSTVVRRGDVVIQRGTRHQWRVHGPAPCVMLFVLIAAPPPAPDR